MRLRPFGTGLLWAACLGPAVGQAPPPATPPAAPAAPAVSSEPSIRVEPLSWADAVDAAWRRSAQSAEAAGQVLRAQAERAAASSWWAAPPALEVGVVRDRPRGGGGAGGSRETEVGVALPLWLPGQRGARLGQVDAELSQAGAAEQAGRLQVAGRVREAAAEVALQRADRLAAEAQARELQTLAQDVERRVAAGDLARADALAAQAERLAAATALAQARQRVQAAELQWQALTGSKDLPDLPSDAGPPAPPSEHPALRAAALDVERARRRVEVVKASRRESPELVVRGRQEVTAGEPEVRGVGVALRVPFGTAARNEPLMAEALSQLELAQATERELRQQLSAEQAAASTAQASARQQRDDERSRARLLRERASLVEKSFRAGETALPDLLRALTAAAQAEAAAARAQAALAQAALRLMQAQGVMP